MNVKLNSEVMDKLSIEKFQKELFDRMFARGEYPGQRLGQAFYNHFKLHKLNDRSELAKLYEKDGADAVELINSMFEFH